jgi:hypothetical protein
MKWVCLLLFNFLTMIMYGQNFSGYTTFPDTSPVDSVKVVLEGEQKPTSYSATFVNYSPLGNTGTAVTLSDDSNVGPFNIGFNFKFFGTTYSQFRICTNGFITFGDPSGRYSPGSFPDASSPNGVVAPYWTDLYPSSGYYCRYRIEGTAPYRKLVITWHVTYYSAKSTWTDIQCVLFETTDKIHLTILSQGKTQTATQGVENPTGTAAFTPTGRNLSSFNGAGTTYELAPVTTTPGWQKIDSSYTNSSGYYSLNGLGNNYNYQLRVETPTFQLTNSLRYNILNTSLRPDLVNGNHLLAHDVNQDGKITVTDFILSYNYNTVPGTSLSLSEYNTMSNSTFVAYPGQVSKTYDITDLDFIILHPSVLLNNTSFNIVQ